MVSRVIFSIGLYKARFSGSIFFAPMQIKKSADQRLQKRIGQLLANKDKAPIGISSTNARIGGEHIENSIDFAKPVHHQAPIECPAHHMSQRPIGPKLTSEFILAILEGTAGTRVAQRDEAIR